MDFSESERMLKQICTNLRGAGVIESGARGCLRVWICP